MRITVTIAGITHEARHSGSTYVFVDIPCPLCGAPAPMKVIGHAKSQTRHHDTIRTRADALCCGPGVGELVVHVETMFGLDEDERVMARGRVYG